MSQPKLSTAIAINGHLFRVTAEFALSYNFLHDFSDIKGVLNFLGGVLCQRDFAV